LRPLKVYNIYRGSFFWVVFGLLIGSAVLKFDFRILLVLSCCCVCAYAISKRPRIALVAIIVSSSSIFYFEAVQVPIGGGYEIAIQEVIIVVMFLLLALRIMLNRDIRFVKSPVNLPMLFFLSTVILSSFWSIFHFQISRSLVFWDARTLFHYSLFFLVPYVIRDTREVRFVISALFIIAAVVSVMMLSQFFIGPNHKLFIGKPEMIGVTPLETGVGARITPPGELLIFVTLFVSLSLIGNMSKDNFKRIYIFLAFVFGLGLLLTFTRSLWTSTMVGFLIILYFARRGARWKLTSFAAIALICVIAFSLLVDAYSAAGPAKKKSLIPLFEQRFLSIFEPESYKEGTDSTFETRTYEFGEAAPYIKTHPIIGIGFHNPYRWRWSGDNYYGYHFVHNAYLFLLLKMGLLGLLAYVWLSIAFLKRSLLVFRNTDDLYLKGVVLGAFVSYIGILISNVGQPTFWNFSMVPCIALMMGLTEAIWNINNAAQKVNLIFTEHTKAKVSYR
jgi:O-antigen ligase